MGTPSAGAAPVAAKAPAAKPSVVRPPVVKATVPPALPAPGNPSDTQIANASVVKVQAAKDVGRLSGLVAAVETQITGLDDQAELAKEKLLQALYKLEMSKTAATTAQQAVTKAGKEVDAARARFRLSVASDYMNRNSTAGSLLTAPDPNVMLQRSDLNRYTETKQTGGLDDLNRATVAKSNADATARGALTARTKASQTASSAAKTAVQAAVDAKSQRKRLVAQKAGYETQLEAAGERLTGLKDKRAAYLAWQKAEARRKAIEAARRAAERRRELAAQERERKRQEALAAQQAAKLAAQRVAAQQAARQAAQRRAQTTRAAELEAVRRAQAQRTPSQSHVDPGNSNQDSQSTSPGDNSSAGNAFPSPASSSSSGSDGSSSAVPSASSSSDSSGSDGSSSAVPSASSNSDSSSDGSSSAVPSASSNSGSSGSDGSRSAVPSASSSSVPSTSSNSDSSSDGPSSSDSSASSSSGSSGSNGTDGSSSSGSSSSGSNAIAGNGSWTPARGRAAAQRALSELGLRYSFAAGDYQGPTLGVCVTNDAGWNDCHVRGFDCSGLTLYAWGSEGIYMPHYSVVQYGAGSVHPSVDQLQPGDLVFWSSDGQRDGIHHVAIYIGNGNVVQAPQSGDVVKITPMWSNGYFDATRPGT